MSFNFSTRRSLSIQQCVSVIGIDLSLIPYLALCVSICLSVRKVYYGKTADWIRMRFGVVSGVGRGTGVLDGSGDRQREWAVLGVNLERLIVTSGDFAA